jgi:hypothetical protein
LTHEEKVKTKWPDAELSKAFAVQPDKSRQWMWCVMSSMKFLASRGRKNRVVNIGSWCFSEAAAWEDAAQHIILSARCRPTAPSRSKEE